MGSAESKAIIALANALAGKLVKPDPERSNKYSLSIDVHHVEAVEPEKLYTPKKIIRNGPATIVMWPDGTKTVVKRAEGEENNTYSAFCAALAIKIFGSDSRLEKIVKNLTEEQK